MTINGLIFDFDGLILDTETPRYKAWCEIYQHFNLKFDLSDYAKSLGSSDDFFNPIINLATKSNQPIDEKYWRKHQSRRELELLADQPLMPGVLDYLNEAHRLNLKMAIASSSDRAWVISHLDRFGLMDFFSVIETADEVPIVKPNPDLYQKAISDLRLEPWEAIAFEDAPHGIVAAKKAGLFCVAVPNPLSAQLDLSHADLMIKSFDQIHLPELLLKIESKRIST